MKIKITGNATGARMATLPDATGTVLVTGNGSSPIQTQRVGGCATGDSRNAACDSSINWTTPFADTNYTVACSGSGVASGVPVLEGTSISTAKTTSGVTVRTIARTGEAAQFNKIECIAVHD